MKYCNIGCCINNDNLKDDDAFTLDRYLEMLPLYREVDIRHIELSSLMDLSEEDGVKIRKACNLLGISVWSIHSEHFNEEGGMSPGGAYAGCTMEEYFEKQIHCAKVAHALTAPIFVCHLPNYTKSPRFDLERNLQIMTRLADITRQYDLTLALENCLPGDMEHIIRLVDKINRPDVGINLDTGHYFVTKEGDIAECIRRLGKRLVTLHLHDNFGHHDDHQAPGFGCIDWPSVVKALKESPYEGPLMLELTCKPVKRNREDQFLRKFPLEKELRMGPAYLRSIFQAISAQY